jgi:hypothetical protein
MVQCGPSPDVGIFAPHPTDGEAVRRMGHPVSGEKLTRSLSLPTHRGPCRRRIWRRRGGAACVRGSWDTRTSRWESKNHARGAKRCGAWNGGVWDSAWWFLPAQKFLSSKEQPKAPAGNFQFLMLDAIAKLSQRVPTRIRRGCLAGATAMVQVQAAVRA